MRTSMPHSFRRRLFVAFLAVSLVPLLLCSAMLLQIFRLRMTDAAQAEAAGYLTGAAHILDTTYEELSKAASQIPVDRVFVQMLQEQDTQDTQVYSRLFSATQESRSYARFDLYDAQGTWRYSTHHHQTGQWYCPRNPRRSPRADRRWLPAASPAFHCAS